MENVGKENILCGLIRSVEKRIHFLEFSGLPDYSQACVWELGIPISFHEAHVDRSFLHIISIDTYNELVFVFHA